MNTEKLNALKDRAYKTAVAHGFHEEEKPDAYWLGLVMSEMGEAINADQKGLRANVVRFVEDMELGNPFRESFEAHIKDSLEDELADVVIRLLDFSGRKGIELSITPKEELVSHISEAFDNLKLPGVLFCLAGVLHSSILNGELESYICDLISILSDCFKKITGRDYDLWWFVDQKMQYNEQRPKLNGKEY